MPQSDGSVIIGIEAYDKGAKAALLGTAKTAAAVTTALVGLGAAAVIVASNFETSFAKTQTIMDTAMVSVGDMREEILDLSITSGMAATDVSEAVYQAISGSVDTADAAQFVSQANKLAVAGFTSLTNATDVLTTTLNAYGLEAGSVAGISNVLIQTQNLGKTSVDELASSMGRAISTGSAYGVNLENLSAAYVELTRGGIATSEATSYLSGMLNELGDSGSTVGKVLQMETSRSFGELMEDGYSLADVLKILLEHVNGNTEALMGLWGSQEAGKASNAIAKQGLEDFNDVLRQMQQEMSGATTTTEDAYEIMTGTSEFIDTQFKNALKNLGIAAGDQLTPALNHVKTALTDALSAAADLVADCPAITAGLTGVAAAAGTLAVAIGGLVVASKAKAAIDALNISLAANPFIMVASAVAGLAAAIGTLAAQADDAVPSVEELTEASSTLGDAITAAKENCDDSIASTTGAADAARRYVDRLAELEVQGLNTAEAQREYEMTVDALNALIPSLNLAIDEQTGLVVGGTEALYDQIDAWKELAVAEALQKQYKETVEAWAAAEAEVATNRAKVSMTEQEAIPIENALRENQEKQLKLKERILAVQSDENLTFEESSRLAGQYNQQLTDLGFEAQNLKMQLEDNAEIQDAYNTAIANGEEKLKEHASAVDEAKTAYQMYKDGLNDGLSGQEAQAEATEAQTTALSEYQQQLSGMQEALSGYAGAFEAAGLNMGTFSQALADSGITADEAAAGIENYRDRIINATDTISQKSDEDMAALIDNMQQRVEAYQNWNTTIMQLQTQFGGQLSSDFLDFVKNLGPEYNDVVSGWLTDGNTQMTEEMRQLDTALRTGSATAVESYGVEIGRLPDKSTEAAEDSVRMFGPALEPMAQDAASTGKAAGEDLVAEAHAGIAAELPDLKTYAKSSGDDVGYQFALGLAEGIRRGIPAVSSASSDAANVPGRTTRNIMQTHSPSKVADAIGYWWPVGLAHGIDRGTPLVEMAAQTQSASVVEISADALEQARLATEPVVPAPIYYENTIRQTQPGGTAQLRASIEVPVYLDGREIARGTARYMGEQMDFEVI